MKYLPIGLMKELPLSIGLLAAIGAIAAYLIRFHLIETIIVYSVSFAISLCIFAVMMYRHYRDERAKTRA